MNKRIKKILLNPFLLFETLGHRGVFKTVDDDVYLKILYRIRMGKKLNLDNPLTYTEKLQWLKINDRRNIYTSYVDKYLVKEIVSNKIGEEYIIPTLGVWDEFDDINFDLLPDKFVLKCTHDSGGIFICKNKLELNKKKLKRKINSNLKNNFFWGQREWPYKNIKPRIIAEKYMEDSETNGLLDYKFFCFNGNPEFMFVASDRMSDYSEAKFDFFNMEFKNLDIQNGHPNSNNSIERPESFEKMIELCKKISKDMTHVRVDFYQINGEVFFGEVTFYHWSGLTPFYPEKWDMEFGKYIEI